MRGKIAGGGDHRNKMNELGCGEVGETRKYSMKVDGKEIL